MRNLPFIEDVWKSGGPFVGDRKPVTRVFVQLPWDDAPGGSPQDVLRLVPTSRSGGSRDRGLPFRWYQNQANSQPMRELPNIQSITIDRSIDQDAASVSINLSNQWMFDNTQPRGNGVAAGQPGYFTATRGDSMEARARWNHSSNEWNNILVPNAVLRVYTGFGGETGDVFDAVAAGNLALYGVFLVDEIRVSTNGTIAINGRDMAKLLIEQQLFPPLVPESHYPLSYERWYYDSTSINAARKAIPWGPIIGSVNPGDKRTVYIDSAVDRWYGRGASIFGNRGSHSVDGDPHTYALSVGNSHPSRPFATDWWTYECGEPMNAVYLHPWAGNYVMYISIMENGQWQPHADPPQDDNGVIPYDPSHLFATQNPAVDTGAGIPYIAKFTVPHEEAREYLLPRVYNAQQFRITFRNHYYSGLGQWKYRVGIREVRARGIAGTGDSSTGAGLTVEGRQRMVTFDPIIMAGGAIRDHERLYSQGYITCSNFGQFDAFGDSRLLPASNPQDAEDAISLMYTPDAKGYYTLSHDGRVRAHGEAQWYGDPHSEGHSTEDGHPWDIAVTHTGNGYWILNPNGTVWCYGDAVDFGVNLNTNAPYSTTSIAAHPTAMGLWLVRNDGRVFNYGAAGNFGQYPDIRVFDAPDPSKPFTGVSPRAVCIRSTSDGDGFWVLTSQGQIRQHGNARKWGEADPVDHSENIFTQIYWSILPAPDDQGYLLLHASGAIHPFGHVKNFGSARPGGEAQLRSDGNYTDYADIAHDLARWSGFTFWDDPLPGSEPTPIYGAIETTGSFSDEKLPDDIFDKRPVVDALTAIRESVGYVCWIDEEGRFRWESPNFWKVGNFDMDGEHVEAVPEIDERVQLADYTVSTADEPLRSSITISTADPRIDNAGTVTHTYVPPTASRLRGLVKPAMWINGWFMNSDDQRLMAEMIGLHISFQERMGNITCVASPHLSVNDQVRVYERQSAETYIHYIRGISFNHNLDSGDYRMTLTTHWLAAGTDSGDIVGGEHFPVTAGLRRRIERQQRFAQRAAEAGGRL